jgi:chromosome partitioning protein
MNASISLGVRPAQASPSIVDALLRMRAPSDVVREVPGIPNLRLVAGGPRLADATSLLRHVRQPERRLADVLRPLSASYDWVIVDAPAGFSIFALSVPLAVHQLLVCVPPEYLPLESLASFLRWYRGRRDAQQATADVAGILLTRVNGRRQSTREIIDIVRAHNRRGVCRTEIPDDPRAPEAPSHGVPLVLYAPRSRAAAAYTRLATELTQRAAHRGR